MTTYYVDFTNGSDSNNGLGPDASNATNAPWKTVTKLLGASGMSSGDIAYLAPGSFRETVTVNMTSATSETKIIGDPQNIQGFKTSGGVSVSPGEVRITGYTTDDKTTPSSSALLNLNSRDFLTFQNIVFVSGANTCIAGGTDATNISIIDSTIISRTPNEAVTSNAITVTSSFGTALNWLIERCIIICFSSVIALTLTTGVGSDYDINFVIKNSYLHAFASASCVTFATSGSSVNKGNGVHIRNSTLITNSASAAVSSTNTNLSNTIANTIYNCVIIGTLNAGASSGLITEDYNRIMATTAARSNVSIGAHSISSNAMPLLVELGQSVQKGGGLRPWFMPSDGSPLLDFGNNDGTTTDFLGTPRPSGTGLPAVGYLERNDIWLKETSTVRSGTNALSCIGPGIQDFQIPVDSFSSYTVTVFLRYDSTYTGTKPQLAVLNGTATGVSDATATMTAAANTWEQVSLTFTPTSSGVVTIRLISNDTNGGGKAIADDFNIY